MRKLPKKKNQQERRKRESTKANSPKEGEIATPRKKSTFTEEKQR